MESWGMKEASLPALITHPPPSFTPSQKDSLMESTEARTQAPSLIPANPALPLPARG